MRFAFYKKAATTGIAAAADQQSTDTWFDITDLELPFAVTPTDVATLDDAQRGTIRRAIETTSAKPVDLTTQTLLPPISPNARIFCIGLNYADHADESKMEKPAYPVVFLRTLESFVGHGVPIVKPRLSDAFDYEGEMVAVLSRGGRYIDASDANAYIAGYSVSNEGSIRDYQLKRGPQWTMGKNFDSSGSVGPYFVTADALPPLGKGLAITTRVNDEIVQQSNTANMIFDVGQIIAYLSEAFVLKPGDVIVSGTPAGVGAARKPPLFVKAGDTVEVEVERIGRVINEVVDEEGA
ncbi:fumarylacetoacetate hydrolase family protein [Burkholderia sp. S171]|uniref:fumarylacetoacetate hydrolase family protein n=1 Tax=Burkholderia sp. S171 TaxID=1641860 RepID=UPI00131D996C|nr:fumarylacetoacetate hydrolase family protein [Burkholderia sp. S171]